MIGKKGMGLLVVLMIVASAGCLGGKPATGTNGGITNSTRAGITNSEKAGTPANVSPSKRGSTNVNIKGIVAGIETYSYHQDAVVNLDVTTTEGNITMKTNVSMLITEDGYVDMVDRRALMNSTITLLPDNLTENMTQVVIGNRTYIKTGFGVNVVNFTTLWDSHPLEVVKGAIKEKPIARYMENGTTVLVYSPPEDVVLPVAEAYLGLSYSNLTITDAVLEIYVANGTISRIELAYSLSVKTSSNDAFGHVEVLEVGTWKSVVEITSTNEKRDVKPPAI